MFKARFPIVRTSGSTAKAARSVLQNAYDSMNWTVSGSAIEVSVVLQTRGHRS